MKCSRWKSESRPGAHRSRTVLAGLLAAACAGLVFAHSAVAQEPDAEVIKKARQLRAQAAYAEMKGKKEDALRLYTESLKLLPDERIAQKVKELGGGTEEPPVTPPEPPVEPPVQPPVEPPVEPPAPPVEPPVLPEPPEEPVTPPVNPPVEPPAPPEPPVNPVTPPVDIFGNPVTPTEPVAPVEPPAKPEVPVTPPEGEPQIVVPPAPEW